MISESSKKIARLLPIALPTVVYGASALLPMLIPPDSSYIDDPLWQDLFRAGHAHTGILLILSLVILQYINETSYSEKCNRWIRSSLPVTTLLWPLAFIFFVFSPTASRPNSWIYLAYAGVVILVLTLIVLGVGLLKTKPSAQ